MVLSKDLSVNSNTETATIKAFQESVSTFTYEANFKIIGKCDPQKLSYPGAFRRVEGSLQDLAIHISKGHPWKPALTDDGARRVQFHCNFAEILGVDIDAGMTIEEALDHPFIGQFCGLAIESTSSAPEHNKFRLVFRFEQPLTDWQDIRLCIQFLFEKIGAGDEACKDASRFFFGAKDREAFLLNESARLPGDFLEQARKWQADQEREAQEAYDRAQAARKAYPEFEEKDQFDLVREALTFIDPKLSVGDGRYPECFPVLCGLVHGLGESAAIQLCEGWSPSIRGCSWDVPKLVESISKGRSGVTATLGTVFHIAKQHGFKFPSYETRKAQTRYNEVIEATAEVRPEKTYSQVEWKCLETVDFKIGDWKKFYVDASEEWRVDKLQERAKTDKTIRFLGVFEGKKDGVKTLLASFEEFQPKTDFAFEVEKVLKADKGEGLEGGFVLKVLRVEGSELVHKSVFIRSSETNTVKDFKTALQREYGSILPCTISHDELQELLQNREAVYRRNGGRTYRLAPRVGKQHDGTWVFEDCQLKPDGTPTTEAESLWVFNQLLGETEKIPSPKIGSPDPKALNRLVLASKKTFSEKAHGFVLLECGKVSAISHRDTVMSRLGYFPQSWIFGEKNSGKTYAATIAVSMVGMHKFTISKFTESVLYERVKSLGCLAFLVDDPIKPGKRQPETRERVEDFLWNNYGGASRVVRGNTQTPHTSVLFTGNVAVGENAAALESRLIKWEFPKEQIDKSSEDEMQAAIEQASSGFYKIAAIQYDHEAFRSIVKRLNGYMPDIDSRIVEALALNIFFTQEFLKCAKYEFDVFEFCVKYIVPQMATYDSTKDSLTDFLEKLDQLQAENHVGEWCMREVVTREGKRFLAVYLSIAWEKVEKHYNPNYSRQGLQALIEAAGGKINQNQKLVASRTEWMEYQKAISQWNQLSPHERNAGEPPAKPKPTESRKCALIPASLLPSERSEEPTEAVPEVQESDDWTSIEGRAADPGKVEHAPLSDGWQPIEGDAILVMDGTELRAATVLEVPGENPFWKVAFVDSDKPLILYSVDAMRPYSEVAA
ncbi:hypothetical protein [Leptolyngbya sp. FACHB-17]|uniref:hypothetical protein n=1 Tax=unclassified Leptolyngbya TaxID=2650499 RepID=UPI001681BD7C|nr:hypothetical protein [Leptolyngbya sp. FACHB-17]MBD2078804.1 hypothetical protein [Leptolyngbya sp. FACHB-17]